jgi:hypothetical protein
MARECRPIFDRSVLRLIQDYLKIKQQQGTGPEKIVYHDMTVKQFIHRVITKRPLAFVGSGVCLSSLAFVSDKIALAHIQWEGMVAVGLVLVEDRTGRLRWV